MNEEGTKAIEQLQNINLDPEIYQLSNTPFLNTFEMFFFF